MIPRRVRLSGFLSYRDEQEIVFDGSPLWMLAGLNGSGKSSIFDAATYALFGHHRGGARDADQLINKDSRALSVDFEFQIDGQVLRDLLAIRRKPVRFADAETLAWHERLFPAVDAVIVWIESHWQTQQP